MEMTLDQKIADAKQRAAAIFAALTPEQRAEQEFLLIRFTHRMVCCYYETIEETGRVRRREDLSPVLMGDGCLCRGVPMSYKGPE